MAFTDVPALGTAAVTRHRSLGTHKSTFCKRGSVNVRFAPKATEVLRRRKASLCANKRSRQFGPTDPMAQGEVQSNERDTQAFSDYFVP
jgi:hypothetical protein